MKLTEVEPGTPKADVIEALISAHACGEALVWVRRSKARTAEELWQCCPDGYWMWWLVSIIGAVEAHRSIDEDRPDAVVGTHRRFANWIRRNYESPWKRYE